MNLIVLFRTIDKTNPYIIYWYFQKHQRYTTSTTWSKSLQTVRQIHPLLAHAIDTSIGMDVEATVHVMRKEKRMYTEDR